MQYPFCPAKAGTQAISLGTGISTVTLADTTKVVWLDNRGTTDVLVQFSDTPALVEGTAFRVPANASQPLTVPGWAGAKVQLRRPTGASSETLYLSQGSGF